MFTTRAASVLVCAFLASASESQPLVDRTGGYGGSSDTQLPAYTPTLDQMPAYTPASPTAGTPKAAAGKVTLLASKGEVFEVDERTLMNLDGKCQSVLIGTMIEDSGTEEAMPLPNVKTATLSKILVYMGHHAETAVEEIQKPLKSTNLQECGVSEWDATFVDIPQEDIFELILAANYLDMKELLDLTCAKIASMIKGKNPEEIRKQFNIVNDFTPEEEAQIKEENRWCEDAQ